MNAEQKPQDVTAPSWMVDGKPGQILELLPQVAKRVGSLAKTHTAKDLPYKFRSIDDLLVKLQPALIDLGITTQIEVLALRRDKDGKMHHAEVKIALHYIAPDGSWIRTVAAAEARDHSDKATNKAITAAVKNAHLHTFQVPTGTKRDTEYGTDKGPRKKWSAKAAAVVRQIEAAKDPAEVKAIMDGPAYQGVRERERDEVRQVAVSMYRQLVARRAPGGADDWPAHDFKLDAPEGA